MDVVELFLLFIVGFSVSFFLIIDCLDSSFEKRSNGGSRRVGERINLGGAEEGAKEDDLGRGIGEVGELGFSGGDGKGEGEVEGEIEDDWEWEGIERSELEKTFGEAVVFVSRHGNADEIAMVKMDLYGLQQVALRGPCHGSQPLPFNIPARSKWNAWHRVGDMSREVAMETYIEILSKAIPGWKDKDEQNASGVEDETLVKQNIFTFEAKS